MLNQVVLIGRLVKDPELRYTPNGVANTVFNLAVNRNYPNGQGEYEADFIQIVAWRKTAENIASFLKKGSMVAIAGQWRTRNYEGNDGKRVFVNECLAENVRFLDSKPTNQENNTNKPPHNNHSSEIDISDDDLPF